MLLDIYNDYLFCHGYTSNEVVNSKTFNKFMLDYNNIKGFIGVKNDKVYPFISNNSRTYTILNENDSNDTNYNINSNTDNIFSLKPSMLRLDPVDF